MLRRFALVSSLVLGLSGVAWAGHVEDQQAEIGDILHLAQQGMSDEIIIKHIEARAFVFDLTADDILDLHNRGLSDVVIEAMLDTGIDGEPSQRGSDRTYVRDDGQDGDVYLSPGYFSPWYYYPYAWGFYYDPFPAHFALYYYPFAFGASWGWYGSCHYWYPYAWSGYRWCDPYWYGYANAHHGCWVHQPYSYPTRRWQSGRGLPSDRGPVTRTATPVNRVHDVATPGRRGQPVDRRSDASPAPHTRSAQPASGPRDASSWSRNGRSVPRVRDAQPVEREPRPAEPASSPSPRIYRFQHDRAHTRSGERLADRAASPRSPSRTLGADTGARLGTSVRLPFGSSSRFGSAAMSPRSFGASPGAFSGGAPRIGGGMSMHAAPHFGGGGGFRR